MRTRRGTALGGVLVALTLAASSCSSSSSSQGVVSTTVAADTSAPAGAGDTTTGATDTTGTNDAADTTVAPARAAVKSGGEMVVGIGSDPPSLDPAGNSASLENGTIYDAVYDRLMNYTIDGTVDFGLAEDLVEAPDRLSWTITLRQGVTFHDGTPFDAEAVKFNLERQRTSVYNQAALTLVTSVEVVDPSTVKVSLSQPWTAFPVALATVVGTMASPGAVATNPDGLLRNPVGTGPYKFVSWTPNDSIVVERNVDYWAGPTPLDKITYKLIPVEAARVAAFEAGELDTMLSINDETAEAEADQSVVSAPSTGYGLVLLNQTKAPFDDVRVRRALVLGQDRDALADAYQGQGYDDYAWSPFVKGSSWWSAPASGETLKYDPDQAKALIDDYGQPVEFTLLVLAGNQVIEDSSRATVEYWSDAGIKANIEIVPDLGTYVTRVVTGDYDAVGWINQSFGDPDVFLYNQLHTGGALNYGKYSNPDMDRLLEQARVEVDEAKRHELYDELQELFRSDVPFLQTSHGPLYLIGHDDVAGLEDAVFFPSRRAGFAA